MIFHFLFSIKTKLPKLNPHRKMYFVTFGEAETFEIQSCNLDGSGREILHTIEAQPGGLALDAKNDM